MARLEVAFGNCADVLAGPRCVPGSQEQITLWVRADAGIEVEIQQGSRTAQILSREPVDGGQRVTLQLSGARHALSVTAGQAQWSLAIIDDAPDASLGKIRALFGAGEFAACEALIQERLADPANARLGSTLRLAGVFYHTRGQPERARGYYERAVAQLVSEGRTLEATRAASAQAYLLQHVIRDFGAARAALASATVTGDASAEARFFSAYDRALIEFNSGHPRAALTGFDDAARIARRMGTSGKWLQRRLDAEELLASQLQRIGRRDQARQVFAALQAEDLSGLGDCERAQFYSNVAWADLLALEAGDAANNPAEILNAQVDTMTEHCGSSDLVALHIHRALALWHAGQPDAAASALAAAQAASDAPELRLRFWELDLAARIAAARGDTDEALSTLDTLARLAGATLSPDAAWRAAARRGEVLENAGRVQDAIAAYTEAERIADDDVSRVPLSAGRGPFTASRDWVTRRHLQLLQSQGATQEAAKRVRAAIARATLAALMRNDATLDGDTFDNAGRDAATARLHDMRLAISEELGAGWRVPADELANLEAQRAERERVLRRELDQALGEAAQSPAVSAIDVRPGDAHLAVHPLREGWLAVAWQHQGTTTQVIDCAERAPQPLAQCTLDALANTLEQTERLVVLDGSPLAQADVAALMLNGKPVVQTHRVIYSAGGLDALPDGIPIGRATVVGDPTRQLPRSRDEALHVAEALSSPDNPASLLLGKAATLQEVRAQLATATLWHFAGHAETQSPDRWRRALALARGETLSVSDVLALPHSPDVVFLSACGTAGSDAADTDGATGLAQAFLVAGARVVVATARPVQDREALALMSAFYAHWGNTEPMDNALRLAQLDLRRAQPHADWPAFRLLTR